MAIYVFVSAWLTEIIERGGAYPYQGERRPTMIGMLEGYPCDPDNISDVEMASRDLGRPVKYAASLIRAQHGFVCAGHCAAVEVDTIEDANALPGFKSFLDISPAFYPLPKRAAVIDCVDGQMVVGRYAAEYAYEGEFVPPPYGENGAYVLSMVPFGMLGSYVFLKEDPEYIYAIPFGTMIIGSDGPVTLARERFAISQREEGIGSTMSP
jgi:hypothetical protein